MKHPEILQKLTLQQKAALLSGKTTWETYDFPQEGVPSIFLSDGPTGLRKQEGAGDHLGLHQSVPATCFPTAATLANSWDETLVTEVGAAIGHEAAAHHVHVLLGPGLNMKRNPLCGRNFEYYSEDPYLAGKLAAGFIRGVQSNGIAACPKHFAVNSQELRRMASDSIVDERTLREIYTTGFEIAVKEGHPHTIMSAYNKVNGTYANEHSELLQDMLKDEWGFDGAVVSDWGGDHSRVNAVKNGSHLAMPSMGLVGQREIVEAVQQGTLEESVLDKRVDELLDVILTVHETRSDVPVSLEAHHELAKRAARQSIVLLKNENGILPLQKGTSVAVIGEFAETPRYQGAGSSLVNPTQVDSFIDVVKQSDLSVIGFAKGYHRVDQADEALLQEAVTVAQKADVVLLYLGLDEISESEGLDRSHLSLPKNQLALLEAITNVHEHVVVLLAAGSVIDLSWDSSVAAVLHGYLNGQAGATAMVDALVGRINPSGKLAETYPLQLSDVPSSKDFPAKGAYSIYREGLFIGYRYFDTTHTPVKYPFGYGLSYTTFEYSNMQVDREGVTFRIKNTGTVYGEEIAQLYVSLPHSNVFRAAKELKGFAKVSLQAGEEKEVHIAFDDKTFRFYNVLEHQWQIEQGEYTIAIASNVEEVRLTASLAVSGVTLAEKQYPLLKEYWTGKVTTVSDDVFAQLLGRPVPIEQATKGQALQENDPLLKMEYAKSPFARFAHRILRNLLTKAEEKGKPDLNLLFMYNMPFRALAKMTNGAIDMPMVDGILTIVNGHFFKGCHQTIRAFSQKRKYEKQNIL